MKMRVIIAREIKDHVEAYGHRMEAVIKESGDPEGAMEEVAWTAENQGFVDSANFLRRDSPEEFVMDVWTENPMAPDPLSLYGETIPRPLQMREVAEILEPVQ